MLWVQAFARQVCAMDRGDTAFGIFIGGTNMVTLCPAWSTLDILIEPKARTPCIIVDRVTNQARGLGHPLAQNLRSWLVHELAHLYLVAATNMRVPVDEVHDINSCFRLRADLQKIMPNKYVYYAGSMCAPPVIFSLRTSYAENPKKAIFGCVLLVVVLQ